MFPAAFYAQVMSSASVLALGVASYAVVRSGGLEPRHRVAWRLFAAVALASGITSAVQTVFGGAALLAGAGTPVWDTYLAWATGMNYGRGLFWYVFAGLLVVHGRPWGQGARVLRHRNLWLLFGAAYAVGLGLGFVEGPYTARHEAHYAILNHGLLLLMTAGLVVAVASDGVDRLLALAVAANIAVLPLYSSWLWWRAHAVGGGTRYPSTLFIQMYYVVFWLVSLAIALRRLWLARRGVPVPGLLASLAAIRAHGLPERRSSPR